MGADLQESSQAKVLQEQAIREMELRRRMRATIVPTNVDAVKQVLRSMGEPITLFGERPVCPLFQCILAKFHLQ